MATYCILSITLGPSGILEARKAEDASKSMQENLSALSSLNSSYMSVWEALNGSPEAIALEARSLGYIAHNETVVRLPDAAGPVVPPSAGKRLEYEPHAMLSEAGAKAIALIAAFVTAVLCLGVRLVRRRGPSMRQRDILSHEALRT